MAKALEILRRLTASSSSVALTDSVFDKRLKKLGGGRNASAARAVLFRTRPAPRAA